MNVNLSTLTPLSNCNFKIYWSRTFALSKFFIETVLWQINRYLLLWHATGLIIRRYVKIWLFFFFSLPSMMHLRMIQWKNWTTKGFCRCINFILMKSPWIQVAFNFKWKKSDYAWNEGMSICMWSIYAKTLNEKLRMNVWIFFFFPLLLHLSSFCEHNV